MDDEIVLLVDILLDSFFQCFVSPFVQRFVRIVSVCLGLSSVHMQNKVVLACVLRINSKCAICFREISAHQKDTTT